MPSPFLSSQLSSIANHKSPESPMWLVIIWTLFLQFCSVSYQSRSIEKLKTQSCPADPCESYKAAVICLFAALAWITLAIVGISTYLAMNNSIHWSASGEIRKPHQPRGGAKSVQGLRSGGENTRAQSVNHDRRNRQAQQNNLNRYDSEEHGSIYSGTDNNASEPDHSSTRREYKGRENRGQRQYNDDGNGGRRKYDERENGGRREYGGHENDEYGNLENEGYENEDEGFR